MKGINASDDKTFCSSVNSSDINSEVSPNISPCVTKKSKFSSYKNVNFNNSINNNDDDESEVSISIKNENFEEKRLEKVIKIIKKYSSKNSIGLMNYQKEFCFEIMKIHMEIKDLNTILKICSNTEKKLKSFDSDSFSNSKK